MFLYVVKAPLPAAFQVPLCSGSEKCQLQALFFLFLGHPPLDFWRKIGRDATVLKFSFSLARSAHKVFVYIPFWRKIWVCSVWVWSFYHACKVFEVIPSSFVSLNPLLCSSIVSCPSINLLCGLLFNIAVPRVRSGQEPYYRSFVDPIVQQLLPCPCPWSNCCPWGSIWSRTSTIKKKSHLSFYPWWLSIDVKLLPWMVKHCCVASAFSG